MMKRFKTLLIAAAALPIIAVSSYSAFGDEGKDGPSCHGKRDMMSKLDTDKDGKISKQEFMDKNAKRAETMFAEIDTNKDGVIDAAEEKAWQEKMRKHHHGWKHDKPGKPDAPEAPAAPVKPAN